MTADEGLRLPPPAGELWVENRDAIRRALDELGTGYSIGGGTVLAARWNHRRSYDIDILVPKGTRLSDLDDKRFEWFHTTMKDRGATGEYSPELNFVNLRFDGGNDRREIQIWAREPMLRAGHGPEPLAGRTETVLSNAQILRGKLERARKKLSRDVYDVLKSRELDPEQLEIAVSTMRHEDTSSIVSDWLHGRDAIVRHAASQLTPSVDQEIDYPDMAVKAAFALIDSRYERFRITAEPGHINVDRVTEGGDERSWKIHGSNAEERFASLGIEDHLTGKGPGAEAIRQYAERLCQETTDKRLVYEEHDDRPVRWRTATSAHNLDILIPARPSEADCRSDNARQERSWWSR